MSMQAAPKTEPPRIEKPEPKEVFIRRFELPDLSEHGRWMMPRLLRVYQGINEAQMAGFLNAQLYSAEMSFLYSKNAVGMAQLTRATTLQPKPIVYERFVFCRDPQDQDHILEALGFYEHWATWTKHHGGDTVIVLQASDVPAEMLHKRCGRLMKTEQLFLKV